MPQPVIQGSLATCCVTGSNFVIHPLARDQTGLTSFAAEVAHHTMDWLLDRGIKPSSFCVRAAANTSKDGDGPNEIAVETELKGESLDDTTSHELATYVQQRARLPVASAISLRWAWKV